MNCVGCGIVIYKGVLPEDYPKEYAICCYCGDLWYIINGLKKEFFFKYDEKFETYTHNTYTLDCRENKKKLYTCVYNNLIIERLKKLFVLNIK